MKQGGNPLRFRPVSRFSRRFPRLMYVNAREPQQGPLDQSGGGTVPVPSFVADGYIYPKPQDTIFDVIVRVPNLPAATTSLQSVFAVEDRIKGGWIRGLGYGFNNPHGFFQVQTFLLVNGAVPSRYVFKTVTAGAAPTVYSGSFPPVQIGSIQEPANVFILLPSSGVVDVRFVNNSADEAFSAVVRLWGWNFGN